MIHFVFRKEEPRYLFLKCDTHNEWDIMNKLKDHINLVDPICHLKSYRGPVFTQDFLFEYTQPMGDKVWWCAIGLWQEIYKFFKENNVSFDGLLENQNMFKNPISHSLSEFIDIVDSWGLSLKPRPYQYEAAYKILKYKQSISGLATRAGKTLIAYMIFRYASEYLNAKRILMIVPSVDLVKQGYNDFQQYKEYFNAECVWSGGKLVESSNLTIGTFQSLIKFLDRNSKKYNPSFFNGYDVVFVDETHRASAEQIRQIISQPFMKNVKISFGMTGTIPQKKTIPFYCVKALLGATIQEITPKELMDHGYISKIDIRQIRLNYVSNFDYVKDKWIECAEYCVGNYVKEKDENGNVVRVMLPEHKFLMQYKKTLPNEVLEAKATYPEEEYIQYLKKYIGSSDKTNLLVVEKMLSHFMESRIDYLCKEILPKCWANTLILAHHTEYIRYVAEKLRQTFPDRHIEVITGSVDGKERDRIKALLKKYNDCILVASYGVMSTGITLGNLCFGVLFESFKSNVVNMQSLGRGLGISDMKDKYVVFDIIDCFDKKLLSNKIYLQGLAKTKIYDKNQYPYKIINVKL